MRSDKLTGERQERILQAVRDGASLDAAAAVGGVAPATLYAWRKRGAQAASGKFRDFHDGLVRASAECEAIAARAVVTGFTQPRVDRRLEKMPNGQSKQVITETPPDAGLALRYLERRYPERWGRRDRLEVRFGSLREALKAVDLDALTEDELLVLSRVLDVLEGKA